MDENDPLSKYNKIQLDHNHINGAVYSKINFKFEICTLDIRWTSHASFPTPILLNPNNHYNHGFHTLLTATTFCYSDYLLCTVTASTHIIC